MEAQSPAEFMQWFATLGVGGVLAGFMFMFFRKDAKLWMEQWRTESVSNRDVVKEFTAVLRENTAVSMKMITLLEALHRRLDRDEHRG